MREQQLACDASYCARESHSPSLGGRVPNFEAPFDSVVGIADSATNPFNEQFAHSLLENDYLSGDRAAQRFGHRMML